MNYSNFIKNKIDRNLWLPYIKIYEDFNKKIPEELKEIDDLYLLNENFTTKKQVRNVKDILLEIHKKYILPK